MKILVIEDSVLLADTIAEALQNENYAVDIANDGQLGYEHASTGIYDMVILDLMLPKMNGYRSSICPAQGWRPQCSGTHSLRKNRN